MKTSYKSQKGKIRSPLRFSGSIVNCQLFRANGWVFGIVIFAALLVGAPFVSEAATVTAIDPASGTNNGTTSITSVTGTNFKSGWDKENGLVGNWRLDETNGSTTADVSGNNYTGTLTNFTSGTPWTTGKVGNALNFDGVNDYVDIVDADDTKYTGALTICEWAYIRTGGGSRHFAGKHLSNGGSNNPFDFRTDAGATPTMVFVRANAGGYRLWTGPSVTLGTWKYYCVTASDGTLTTAPNFYVDGAKTIGTNTSGSGAGAVTGVGTNIRIGNRADGVVKMDGFIDEVRVYSRALTGTEITDLYNATSGPGYVKLEHVGLPDITCTGFTLTSSTTLSSGGCPLDGVATGVRNVQVTNPDNTVGTLTDGFTVNSASAPPDATSVTYTVGGDGAISGDSVTITGTNFGTPTGVGDKANCSGGANTGCIRFVVGGNATVVDGNVTAWTATSISFTVSSTLTSNGGAASLQVTASSTNDATPLTFYIYPNITAVASVGANAGREYNAADTDGLIMLSGDHFGGAGTATILGSAATENAGTGGSCTLGGYSSTTICYRVPTAISDSTYTGNIVLTRTADSKTSTWAGFRVLPRIASNSPATGTVATVIQITGDHLCQTGTCPVTPNRSSASDNVKFGSTQAADGDFITPTNGATTVTSASLTTSGSNRLLLAVVSIRNTSSQTVSSVSDSSGLGLTWVRVTSSTNSTNVRTEVWRTLAASAFTGTVTATLSASAKATIVASAYSGVNTTGTWGSGAIGVIGSATGNSTAPSVAITTGADNSLVVSGLSAQGTPTVTAGASQTVISTQNTTGGADSTRVTGSGGRQNALTTPAGSVTSNYTLGSSQQWAIMAVEIKKP